MLLGSKYNTTERKERRKSNFKIKDSLKKENLCPTNFQIQLNNPMVEIPKTSINNNP